MYNNDKPKLLEINPRFSGGLRMVYQTGVNIPYNTLRLLMDGSTAKLNIPEPLWGITIDQVYEDIKLQIEIY